MSDRIEATFTDLVESINRLGVEVKTLTRALYETGSPGDVPLADTNLLAEDNDGFGGDDDNLSLDAGAAGDDEPLTPHQRGAITRRENAEKRKAEAAAATATGGKGGESSDATEQPTVTDVQASLKALALEFTDEDTEEGKANGRAVSMDLLSRYGVDSVPKLNLDQYVPLMKQAKELIEANKIKSESDPLDLGDDDF